MALCGRLPTLDELVPLPVPADKSGHGPERTGDVVATVQALRQRGLCDCAVGADIRTRRAPRRGGGDPVELRALLENVGFEAAQFNAGLEAQFLPKVTAQPLIRAERFCLTAASVEAHHELSPQPFAQRVLAQGGFELADDLAVTAERHGGIRSVFEREGVQLLQPLRGGLHRRFVGQIPEGATPPQCQAAVQQPDRVCVPSFVHGRPTGAVQPLELGRVEQFRLHNQPVAPIHPHQDLRLGGSGGRCFEHLAQVADIGPDHAQGRARCAAGPQPPHQRVDAHNIIGV